ncbi:MAG TPA: heavy metal-associated domain-containing protein [Burkholderiales bacterium]|nr:heavy metal-associated domain-containing protein [Burkholderiales bacterium]
MTNTLQISGMTCQHCVRSVTKALQGVAGVDNVSVDLGAGRAQVEGPADSALLLQAVESEGYEAKLLEAQ